MKKLLCMLILLHVVALTSYAQLTLKGAIVDKETGTPVAVRIVISSTEYGSWTAFSTSNFRQRIDLNDEYKLTASAYGYKDKIIIVDTKCAYSSKFTIEFDIEMVRENVIDKSYKLMSGTISYSKSKKEFICTTKAPKDLTLTANKE